MSDQSVPVVIDLEKALSLDRQQIRDYIAHIEAEMLKMPQAELPLTHYFSERVYAREIKIAQGTALVGEIHKFKNLNILSAGRVSVLSIEGIKHLEAPSTFVSVPGVKRLIVAHEDAVWTTIHGTAETSVDKIKEEFIAKNYDEVQELTEPEPSELKEVVWRGE